VPPQCFVGGPAPQAGGRLRAVEFRDFWRDRTTVIGLAVPGVAATMALTTVLLVPVASAVHELEEFTWQHALLFSAVIAATDPIAVVGLLGQ